MDAIDVFGRIESLADQDEGDFIVIKPAEAVDASRPLYLLIHPGDAVQKREDVENCEEDQAEEILGYSQSCQERMASDMQAIDDEEWDVVVLHRISSDYTFANDNDLDWDYVDRIRDQAASENAVLYGDDLDAASDYVVGTLQAADRPHVVIAGAWSELESGCVTWVGKRLEAAGARVYMSQGTSISPDGSGPEWEPALGKVSSDMLLALPAQEGPRI